ncbi:unnamed protein product, partial [Closterium sp. NIES-53]
SGSTHLLMSPPVAPDSSVAPPPWSPLPATPWIRAVRLQLCERFRQDLHVLRLHSDRGGEFSSDLLREFGRGEGILQSFTLPDSPQQNGIAERRIGLVMEVAHTSMIHAAAPHFLWPFAVRYAAHQLNLWPRVSLPETSPTLRWTGKVGDAPVFWVWGSRAFVRDTSAGKLSARAIRCVFLGFSPDAPGWPFYHPTSRHVFPSQDVTFDESVPFYRLFPFRSAPPPPPTLFLAQGPPPIDPLAPSGVSQVDPLPRIVPDEVAVGSGAARGAASGSAASWDAEPGGTESENAGSGVLSLGVRSLGVLSQRACSLGLLSLRVWSLGVLSLRVRSLGRTRLWSGAAGAGDSATRDTRVGGAAVTAGARGTGGAVAAGPGGARARGARAVGAAAGGTGVGGAGARGAGAGGARGTVRPQPYFIPLLQQVLGVPSSNGRTPPLLCPPLEQSQPPLQPASPLTAPSPYIEQTGGLTERREPASRPTYPFRTGRRVPRPCPPPVPGTHAMAVRPSSVPLRVPLPAPLEPSLPAVSDPEFDNARATSPTFTRLLATGVTDPSFESTAASALVVELLDFAAACRLDYATALVAESYSASPPSVGDECALGTDILEDRQEDFECLAAAMTTLRVLRHVAAQHDYEFHSLDFSTAFLQGSLHEEIWLRRPPGFIGSFPACTQWSLRRPVYSLRQAPPPPLDESIELSGPYPELVGCLMCLMTCTRPDLAYPLSLLARYVAPDSSWVDDSATQWSSQGYTFSLGSGSISWRSTRSSSVLSSSCEAEIYAGAMAAQDLRWLTYLLTDLGEQPRSPPVLYVHNKALIALCREHRLEHRTKHVALHYLFSRELQQRGQLRLAYVATRAKTADILTKALPPGDHQRFSTVLRLVPALPHLLFA